jgi:glycine cleavage system H protein
MFWAMSTPDDLLYSVDHEWVRLDGKRVRVGITDYAQDALGDVVYIQLPTTGLSVAAGDAIAEVESTKSVSDVYAPLAGTIVAVNDVLVDTPELVNQQPYADGWLFEMELGDVADLDQLMTAAQYDGYVAS